MRSADPLRFRRHAMKPIPQKTWRVDSVAQTLSLAGIKRKDEFAMTSARRLLGPHHCEPAGLRSAGLFF